VADAAPAISILLPVFNGADFLREQVASILEQTFREFELLIYDDASNDGSSGLLRELAATDARVQLFGSPTNLGQKSALRFLLAKAGGRYLMFSDQDDIWHPGKIEVLYRSIGEASLSYGISELIDSDGNNLGKSLFDFVGPPFAGSDRFDFLLKNTVSGHAMLVRREVVDPGIFLFDADYDWLIATIATFSAGVVYAPDAITRHRQHANNQVNQLGRARPKVSSLAKRRHWIMRVHDILAVSRGATTVPEQKRAVFNRLYNALRSEIILGSPATIYHQRFELAFTEALDSLKIPAVDRQRLHKPIMKICRGLMHPKTIRDMF
jgi:glycosyltransferase involved in cell wall biosynthesis